MHDVTRLCTQRDTMGGRAEGNSQGTWGRVLYELCGGIAVGLGGALADGVKIKLYLYSDISASACAVVQS